GPLCLRTPRENRRDGLAQEASAPMLAALLPLLYFILLARYEPTEVLSRAAVATDNRRFERRGANWDCAFGDTDTSRPGRGRSQCPRGGRHAWRRPRPLRRRPSAFSRYPRRSRHRPVARLLQRLRRVSNPRTRVARALPRARAPRTGLSA